MENGNNARISSYVHWKDKSEDDYENMMEKEDFAKALTQEKAGQYVICRTINKEGTVFDYYWSDCLEELKISRKCIPAQNYI